MFAYHISSSHSNCTITSLRAHESQTSLSTLTYVFQITFILIFRTTYIFTVIYTVYIYIYIRFVYTDKVVFQFDLASIHSLELGPIDVDPPKPHRIPMGGTGIFYRSMKTYKNQLNVGEYIPVK